MTLVFRFAAQEIPGGGDSKGSYLRTAQSRWAPAKLPKWPPRPKRLRLLLYSLVEDTRPSSSARKTPRSARSYPNRYTQEWQRSAPTTAASRGVRGSPRQPVTGIALGTQPPRPSSSTCLRSVAHPLHRKPLLLASA